MRLAILFILIFIVPMANALNISIGATPFSPPFLIASDSKHHFSGFDADLMNEICHRIDATCVYKPMTSFKGLFDSVFNDTVDIGMGGITITPERENQYLFSLPYLKSTAQYITRYGESIRNIADIRGKRVGVAEGTIFQNMVTYQFGQSITLKTFNTLSQMLVALTDGTIDVVLLDGPNAVYWDANSNNLYQPVGKPINTGIGYGFIANKNAQAVILKINQALIAIENDDTYLKIYNTYF